jgi:hypothetical protein
VSVDEEIFQDSPRSVRKDLGFEDVAIRLQDMHAISPPSFLLAPMIGHLPLLARNYLHLSIIPLR